MAAALGPRLRTGPLLLAPLLFAGLCCQFSASVVLCGIAGAFAALGVLVHFYRDPESGRSLYSWAALAVLLEILALGQFHAALDQVLPLVLGILRPLLLGGMLGLLLREIVHAENPRHLRRVFFALLALAGFWGGLHLLVWPLLLAPLRSWTRREKRQWLLFLQQAPLLLLTFSPILASLFLEGALPEQDTSGLPLVLEQARYWAVPALFQTILVFTGRFILDARIRWKLLSTFGLSSLVPILILSILSMTWGVVLMGGYRASLVKIQLQERGTVALMVTRWLMESLAELRQGSLGDFDSRVRSITSEESLSKVFFGLYLFEGQEDSLGVWRPLQSSWRMPGGMFTEKLRLPLDLSQEVPGGFVLAGGRLYSVSMVRRGSILGLGYLPVDQEMLESVGGMLGVEILVRHLRRDDLLSYSAAHIRLLDTMVPYSTLTYTPAWETAGSLVDRFFGMGMARLEQGELSLGDDQDVFVIHIRTSPMRILASVFSGQGEENLIYLLLLALQFLLLLPFFLLASWVAFMTGRRITRSVDELHAGTERLSEGDFRTQIPAQTGDELGDLARSFNLMSRRIQESIIHLAEKSRLEKELAIARRIQRDLLPGDPASLEGLQIEASNISHREVGGDYYDWRPHPAGGWSFTLGDVSGKGVSAAMVMADIQAAWSVLVDTKIKAAELAERLNRHLCEDTGDDIFVTHFHATISPADMQGRHFMCYCNCGHNPPLVLRKGELLELRTGGMILGMFPEAPYERGEFVLEPGDLLLLYTDGLTETLNGEEEEFGEERLAHVLQGGLPDSAGEVIDLLKRRVQDFAGRDGFGDDLTILVIRVEERRTS